MSWSTTKVKNLILTGQLFILLAAFTSIYWQIHGLFGERGLLPIAPLLECDEETIFQCRLPLLQYLTKVFHLSPSVALQLTAFVGILLSSLAIVFRCLQNTVIFGVLYFLYLTIHEAGTVFLYFQWDSLILESTAYVGILAWFSNGPADSIAIFSILTLGIRVILSTGIGRIQSLIPLNEKIGDLQHYYEAEPLPTQLSWVFHQFSNETKISLVVVSAFLELIIAPFFLIPIRSIRWILLIVEAGFLLLTMLTGNYTFFNLVTIVTLISVMDVEKLPRGIENGAAIVFFLGIAVLGGLQYSDGLLTSFQSISAAFSMKPEVFDNFVQHYLRGTLFALIGMFALTVVIAFCKISFKNKKFRNFIHFFVVLAASGSLFVYGTIPLLKLNKKTYESVKKHVEFEHYYRTLNSWNLANSYSLYRPISGGRGRPEIVIEGSHKIDGPWKEIQFYSKPGNVATAPSINFLHQPRLDWQMWIAAMGTYQQNPFFLSLVHHLMENTTEVVQLVHDYPFKNRTEPMNFVKASIQMYRFTEKGDKNWWTRSFQEEYMPVFNKGNEAMAKFLLDSRALLKKPKRFSNGELGKAFKRFHKKATRYEQSTFVQMVVATVVVVYFATWFR